METPVTDEKVSMKRTVRIRRRLEKTQYKENMCYLPNNPSTREAKAERCKVQNQPDPYQETISPKTERA
jgi:hypothetical protein